MLGGNTRGICDRMVYTIRTGCEEEPDMHYDDGARTLFLYTKGTKGNPNGELRALLRYMEDTREECAVNEPLRKIHDMVKEVKRGREVALEYMKVFEWEAMIKRDAREEGLKEGREEGREEGRREELANTQRERDRADAAEKRAEEAEMEVRQLRKMLAAFENNKTNDETTGI